MADNVAVMAETIKNLENQINKLELVNNKLRKTNSRLNARIEGGTGNGSKHGMQKLAKLGRSMGMA